MVMLAALLCSLLLCRVVVWSDISVGSWIIHSINECEEPDEYPNKVYVKKHKASRTHYMFSLAMDLREEIDALRYALVIEAYKKCDGGFKFQQFWNDTSFCSMMNQFARTNFIRLLASAGVNPPNCPIPKGHFDVEDFMIDYTELPPKGIVGEYHCILFLVKDGEKRLCLEIEAQFKEKDADNEDD